MSMEAKTNRMIDQLRRMECSLTVGHDIAPEAPVNEIVELPAALPGRQEDGDRAGDDADDARQDDHKAEVAAAPHARRQRQQRPQDFADQERDDCAGPDL